jgi:hypothetical protein
MCPIQSTVSLKSFVEAASSWSNAVTGGVGISFPAVFSLIKRRVKDAGVNVKMRIRHPVDGPRFAVNETRIDEVSSYAIAILAPYPDSRLHPGF